MSNATQECKPTEQNLFSGHEILTLIPFMIRLNVKSGKRRAITILLKITRIITNHTRGQSRLLESSFKM